MNIYSNASILLLTLIGSMISFSLELAPNSWQKRLDKALLDVDGARNSQSRFRLIQRAIQDPSLRKDISRGIKAVQEKGMKAGHPELIDALWPKGTIVREDIEGIQALTKSIPERIEEMTNGDSAQSSLRDVFNNLLDRDVLQRTFEESTNTKVNRKKAFVLAQNAFRRYPKDVDLLPLSLIDTVSVDDNTTTVEIRQIEESTLYACEVDNDNENDSFTIASMGGALIKLSNYILKANDYDVGSITSPFIIQNSKMYLWNKNAAGIGDNSNYDNDNDDMITQQSFPARTLAMLEFSGICTDGEIERQSNKLKDTLSSPSKSWEINDPAVLVLQYNAPGTLPWRRKNQVAFVVEKFVPDSSDETGDTAVAKDTAASDKTKEDEYEVSVMNNVDDNKNNNASSASDDDSIVNEYNKDSGNHNNEGEENDLL